MQQGAKGAKDHKHDVRRTGLPNLHAQAKVTSTAIEILLSSLRKLLDEAERDNSLIYFETVPEVMLPSPVLLAQTSSSPYEPAALGPLVTFKEVEEESNSDSGSTPILLRLEQTKLSHQHRHQVYLFLVVATAVVGGVVVSEDR